MSICIINLLQLTLKHIQIRIVTILSHGLYIATQLQTIMDMKDTCKRRLVTIAIVLLQLVYL